jgi:hypothetical protein
MRRLNGLRIAAFLMAAVAVADPSVVVQRRATVAVDVRSGGTTLRDRLARELGGSADLDSALEPAAVVLTSGTIDVDSIPAGIPVSTISAGDQGPNVSVLEVRTPAVLRPGWSAPVRVLVRGRRMSGKSSVVALEEQGVELAATAHTWTREDETVEFGLAYVPAAAGVRELRMIARPADEERWTDDNHIVSAVTVQDRRLKVLVHEPRPSWTAAFVRRALEEDPDFEVAALARVSKGLEVRAGQPPMSITTDAIAGFDAVVVGAPEELQARAIDALETFARRRGGTVVYLPDRRPSGAYASRLRTDDFSETLLPSPFRIAVPTGLPLRGSEFIIAGRLAPGMDSLATVEQGGSARPVVISWLSGVGRVIFSGALDAWRHRTGKDGYARFWRATIGTGAAAAPGRVGVTVDRSAVAPGDTVIVRARVRATEFDGESPLFSIQPIRARVVGERDFDEVVRLWPALELGEFEGRLQAPAAGRYDVHVTLDGSGNAETVLLVTDEARRVGSSNDAMRTLALRTGGVSVDESDLTPLVTHLESLTQSAVPAQVHPARSPWWMMGFLSLVSVEWLVLRRRGLR